MQYKIINRITNVQNSEILILADTRTRSEEGHKCFMSSDTQQLGFYILHPYVTSGESHIY